MMMTEGFSPGNNLDEAAATLACALDAGITHLNTGDFYGMGRNELLIGRAIASCREKVFLSVKFGGLRDPRGMFYGLDMHPARIKAYVTYSLHRLGTDYIDLYQPARLDPGVPIEETVGAIKRLVEAGYVRYLGLSEMGAETIRRAHAVHPVTALEFEYSIFSRDVEETILPTLDELGIGLVAYGVYAHGLLSGRIRSSAQVPHSDMRHQLPRFQGENFQRNLDLVKRLEDFALSRDLSLAKLAAAWVLAKHPGTVAVIGARVPSSLRDWLDAAKVQLTPEDLQTIAQLVPQGAVSGTRYPAEQMRMVGR
jgi:aryl-alcohol dehydrogenase-like predicted oxidoreductase